jgi:hypothetical protein
MDNELTHDQFYLWLADRIGISEQMLPVPTDRIARSTDPHLNDIPLNLWDRKDRIVRPVAYAAGMRTWSVFDTLCTLKAVARRTAALRTPEGGRMTGEQLYCRHCGETNLACDCEYGPYLTSEKPERIPRTPQKEAA